ncbi:MAG: 50S ribosomal protein L18 [Candidatus Micrarchaeia archaeon]
MKVHTTFIMPFRRRREGRTDYRRRLSLVRGGETRMVVRRSNKGFLIQFVEYSELGDKTLYTMHSSQLKKLFNFPSKCNTPTAYLSGLYAGKHAQSKGVKAAVADISATASKGANVFAAVKGAIDSGVKIPFDESKVVPERLSGSHLKNVGAAFEEAKKKILS